MKTEIFTKMVLIKPESAEELLKLNSSNRPLNKKTVEWYAKQMKNGEWTISGQTISISDKNTLIDGQHRLAAVIKSGCEILFNIAYNVPVDSFVNYDSMRSRGLSDVFAIEKIPNYKDISAIISRYNAFITGNISNMGFSKTSELSNGGVSKTCKFTNAEALNIYNKNKDILHEIGNISNRCYAKIRLFTPSQIGAFMFFLIVDKKHKKEKVFSFFIQLFFNENVENKSIYYLREKLINGSIGQFRMVARLKYIYLIKCWNAYVLGKEIKIYSLNESETTPVFL